MRADNIKPADQNSGARAIKICFVLALALALALSLSFCSDPIAYAAADGKGTVVNCNNYVNVRSGLKGAGIWELSQNSDGTLLEAVYENIK